MDEQKAVYNRLAEEVVSKAELVGLYTEIITELRKEENASKGIVSKLKEAIKNLTELIKDVNTMGNLTSDQKLEKMLEAVQQVQKISLYMQQLNSDLKEKTEWHTSISYMIYWNGHRVVAENIKTDWLMPLSKTKELNFNLQKAYEDTKELITDQVHQDILNIFDEHYGLYYNLIIDTYKGKNPQSIGGYIAEGFEEHLFQHHEGMYKELNVTNESIVDWDAYYEKHQTDLKKLQGLKSWSEHESVTEAWWHIRHALGNRRGTAGGDVGYGQVKQGRSTRKKASAEAKLHLTQWKAVEDGLATYSLIFSEKEAADVVATQIVDYIYEYLYKTNQSIIPKCASKEVEQLFEYIDQAVRALRKKETSPFMMRV